MRVSINIIKSSFNSGRVCRAMAEGVNACGDATELRSDHDFRMKGFDAAVFWGYWEPCQLVEKSCREAGIPFVYVDLAYWGREAGYFKAAVNARHPTAYVMNKSLPADRWDALGVKIASWRRNHHSGAPIILAGMSGKGAWSWGFKGGEYEQNAVREIRKYSDRPIIYRPKPNWAQAQPIPGTTYDRQSPIGKLLNGAHCVVTHHSNVGSDAVVAGVPVLTRHGAAIHMGLPDDLTRIESPGEPDGREQWAANMAYTQWTLKEMAAGKCWSHLKKEVF